MAKPILFDSISRAKFDGLSDEVKAKKNYLIKETTGEITKHIGNIDVEGDGGNNDFVVTYTETEDEQTQEVVYSADKSFAEILAAIEAGKNVKALFTNDNVFLYILSEYYTGDGVPFINFINIDCDTGTGRQPVTISIINHQSTNDIDVINKEVTTT